MLFARVPSARDGALEVRLCGGDLVLRTGDKNVRHQVDSVAGELLQWLREKCPEVRRIRWTQG